MKDTARERKIGLAWLAALSIVGALVTYEGDAQNQRWNVSPQVSYTADGSPADDVEAAIEYAIWTWESRLDLDIQYVMTPAPVQRAVITFQWVTGLQMYDLRKNFTTKGLTQSWFYVDGTGMAKASVSLNADYFSGDIDACEMLAVAHELGHAIGILEHSSRPEDLMYWAPSHCRYIPTATDLSMTKYRQTSCHAEYNREGDIYIPSIAGHRAMLKNLGDNQWNLVYLERDGSVCASTSIDEDLHITLNDIRSPILTVMAEFDYIGSNTWALIYAE